MRSTDEQLRLIRSKAAKRRQRRQNRLRYGATGAGCLLLIAALGILIPRAGGNVSLPEGVAYGSLVLSSPLLSYIVVAILAFAFGVFVTLLCVARRRLHGTPEEEDK